MTGTTSRSRRSGRRVDEVGHGADHDVGSLQRLDASHEGHDQRVARDPESSACVGLAPRPEDVEVDPGRDHAQPLGLGVVQVDQLLSLVVGVRHDHVRCLDDLLLADDPRHRLGVSPSASQAFFTFAIVCIECTSGTPQRSRASAPTWPESQ